MALCGFFIIREFISFRWDRIENRVEMSSIDSSITNRSNYRNHYSHLSIAIAIHGQTHADAANEKWLQRFCQCGNTSVFVIIPFDLCSLVRIACSALDVVPNNIFLLLEISIRWRRCSTRRSVEQMIRNYLRQANWQCCDVVTAGVDLVGVLSTGRRRLSSRLCRLLRVGSSLTRNQIEFSRSLIEEN